MDRFELTAIAKTQNFCAAAGSAENRFELVDPSQADLVDDDQGAVIDFRSFSRASVVAPFCDCVSLDAAGF